MRLELVIFPVDKVKFGNQISYKDRVLMINKAELIDLILEDKRVAKAELELVHAARCDVVQGYLVSPPIGAGEVAQLLRSPGTLVAGLHEHFPARELADPR